LTLSDGQEDVLNPANCPTGTHIERELMNSLVVLLFSTAILVGAPGKVETPLRSQIISALMGTDAVDAIRRIADTEPEQLRNAGIVVETNGKEDMGKIIKLKVTPPIIIHKAATILITLSFTNNYKTFHGYVYALFTGDINQFAAAMQLTKGKPKNTPAIGTFNRTLPDGNDLCPVTLGASSFGRKRFLFGCGWCNGG